MATLLELIPYLERGFTLRGGPRGSETLTPLPLHKRVVRWERTINIWESPRIYTLKELEVWPTIWEWGAVFIDADGHEYVLTRLADIEQAIRENKPRSVAQYNLS